MLEFLIRYGLPAVIIISVPLTVWLIFWIFQKTYRTEWKVLDQGFYLSVEYGYDTYTTSAAGMANHSKTTRRFDVTVIRFNDGRTCVLRGRYPMSFPSGSLIRIMQNYWQGCRIEDGRQ